MPKKEELPRTRSDPTLPRVPALGTPYMPTGRRGSPLRRETPGNTQPQKKNAVVKPPAQVPEFTQNSGPANTTAKATANTSANTTAKATANTSANTTTKATANTSANTTVKAPANTTATTAKATANTSTNTAAKATANTSAKAIANTSANTTVKSPAITTANTTSKFTANTSVKTTAKVTTSAPVNISADITATAPGNAIVKAPTNALATTSANIPSNTPAKTTTNVPANTTTNVAANAPANTTAKAPANTTVKPPANTTVKPPANITTNVTVNSPANTTVRAPAETTTNVIANAGANTKNAPANTTVNVPANFTSKAPGSAPANIAAKAATNAFANITTAKTPGNTGSIIANATVKTPANDLVNAGSNILKATSRAPANTTVKTFANAPASIVVLSPGTITVSEKAPEHPDLPAPRPSTIYPSPFQKKNPIVVRDADYIEQWEYPSGTLQRVVFCTQPDLPFARSSSFDDPKVEIRFFGIVMALKLVQYFVAIGLTSFTELLLNERWNIRLPNNYDIATVLGLLLYMLGFLRQYMVRRYSIGRHHPQAIYIYFYQMFSLSMSGIIGSLHSLDAKMNYYVFFINIFVGFAVAYLFLGFTPLLAKTGPRMRHWFRVDGMLLNFFPIILTMLWAPGCFLLMERRSKYGTETATYHFLGSIMAPVVYAPMIVTWEVYETQKIIKGQRFPIGDRQFLYVCNCL